MTSIIAKSTNPIPPTLTPVSAPKSGHIDRINLSPAVKVEQGYQVGRKVANKISTMRKGIGKAVSDSLSGECVFFALGLLRALIDKNVLEPEIAEKTFKRRIKVLAQSKWTDESMKNQLFDFTSSDVRSWVDLIRMPFDQCVYFSFNLYRQRNVIDHTDLPLVLRASYSWKMARLWTPDEWCD